MLAHLLALQPHGRSLTPAHIIALVLLVLCGLRIMSLLSPKGRSVGKPVISIVLMIFIIPIAIIDLIN